ncbi:hypothetical protein MFIFM68171_00658 [Madurella fahalii]|uniref:Wax synthase domain-containing protein n=1 Tax=Madurella fahalii TaxID=1157608 RepID=A0ABQ0FY74_9PEZI
MHDGQPDLNLAAFYQQKYRAAFDAALAAGDAKPLIIPWSFIGPVILPLIYLSIPHTQRPWLYRMRWAVAAAVVYLNVRLLQTTSAGNEAVAYATGLIASWGTIWSLTLLIFTRPQWEAARVQRRPRKKFKARANGNDNDNDQDKDEFALPKPPDESVAASWPHHEYFWQRFPANEPFLTRLGWAADLFTAFRGAGWNHSIPCIPHPPFPRSHPHTSSSRGDEEEEPARIDLIPLASRTGVARSPTYASFVRSRLVSFALAYAAIDVWTVTARRDPYFVAGPEYAASAAADGVPQLPPALAALPCPAVALPLLRNLAALAGVLAALHLYHSPLQLLVCCALPALPPLRRLLGPRAELWQHPTLFGSFTAGVLDRGLAGWWGGWWHQTFRRGFVSLGRWLLGCVAGGDSGGGGGDGRMRGGKVRVGAVMVVAAVVVETVGAFFQSGLVHAAGGMTAVPERTVAWTPIAFFMLQAVGVLGQTAVCSVFRGPIDRFVPRWGRRAANFLFVALWLYFTAWGLIDDMSRAGLWLFEPVPVSPLRMMGLGSLPGESWWRWDGQYGLRWYRGKRWWESGIRL